MSYPTLSPDDTTRLRDALAAAGYTVDGVRELLGPVAAAALDRNETVPGRRATSGTAPLDTLTRLWPLQLAVTEAAAKVALPLDALLASGLVVRDGDEVRAAMDVRPYADDAGDWWVVADLTPGLDGRIDLVPDDHVLGVNAASSTLAQLTVRAPIARSLDLGTGCGVQALHLARHSESVIATDISERALACAELTMALNELDVDLRWGNLYEPVAGETFDLIVTNPPFVVSPGGQHVYRDSGLGGDAVSRQVVRDGARRLADGGLLQALANWVHVRGQPWDERVADWVSGTGCDAWIIQREVQDPAEYVELWLRDAGDVGRPDYTERYDAWLGWFEEQRVEGIGFGWIMLQARGGAADVVGGGGRGGAADVVGGGGRVSGRTRAERLDVRIDDWPHAVEQPLGSAVTTHFGQVAALRTLASDDDLLAATFQVAGDVQQEQVGQPGAEDPEHVVLRQQRGMRRAAKVGTAEAGLVGACDGTLPLGRIIGALASVLDADESALRAELLPQVREFIADGYLMVG